MSQQGPLENHQDLKFRSEDPCRPEDPSIRNPSHRNYPSINPFGTKIGEDHHNYALMIDMLTGIRAAVSKNCSGPPRAITDSDFERTEKMVFDENGQDVTIVKPRPHISFKFKDYSPCVFKELREQFKITSSEYLNSLTGKYVLSELGSPGKSGAFFYYSHDYRFIIKTIGHSEHLVLRKILKRYLLFVRRNPNTLLSRFLGLHRVKILSSSKGSIGTCFHFIVMGNIFPLSKDIHEIYDLKGSTLGRQTSIQAMASNPRAVRKDLNWLRSGRKMILGRSKKCVLMDQLLIDVEFLQENNIMDYSLLIGIHNVLRGNREKIRDRSLSVFETPNRPLSAGNNRSSVATFSNSAIQSVSSDPVCRKHSKKIYEKITGFRRPVNDDDPIALDVPRPLCPFVDLPAERKHFTFYKEDGGFFSSDDNGADGNEIYFIGIIDILTPYKCKKKLEHFFKSCCYNSTAMSSISPELYAIRFIEFMKTCVLRMVENTQLGARMSDKLARSVSQSSISIIGDKAAADETLSKSITEEPVHPGDAFSFHSLRSLRLKKTSSMRENYNRHINKMIEESEQALSIATEYMNISPNTCSPRLRNEQDS